MAQARKRAAELPRMVDQGGDPMQERRQAREPDELREAVSLLEAKQRQPRQEKLRSDFGEHFVVVKASDLVLTVTVQEMMEAGLRMG